MEAVFMFFILVVLVIFLVAVLFRYRRSLKRWLHDPKYGSEWRPSREKQLQRIIEDANDEMYWLEEQNKETETGA